MSKKPQKPHELLSNFEVLPIIQPTNINQTIIINSPRFNINYMNQSKRKTKINFDTIYRQQFSNKKKNFQIDLYKKPKDEKKSTAGFDNWILNKNLKEFGQTRQHGFMYNVEEKPSPYLNHKFKKANSTIRHESMLKQRELNNIYEDIHFVNNKTLESKIKGSQKLIKTKSQQETTAIEFRKRKYENDKRARRTIRQIENNNNDKSQYSYRKDQKKQQNQIQQKDNNQDQSINNLTYRSQKKNFRTNKFVQPKNIGQQKEANLSNISNVEKNQQYVQTFRQQIDNENQYMMNQSNQTLNNKKTADKSISQIDKSLKHTFDAYFTNNQRSKSRNDIQIYLSNVKQPAIKPKQNEFVSSMKQKNSDLSYEFRFQQQKKRPRTPVRNSKLQRKDRSKTKIQHQNIKQQQSTQKRG